jgi:hypothetical protein
MAFTAEELDQIANEVRSDFEVVEQECVADHQLNGHDRAYVMHRAIRLFSAGFVRRCQFPDTALNGLLAAIRETVKGNASAEGPRREN